MSEKLSLKVTQASLNQTALDWPQNMANHYAAIDAAVAERSDLLVMPELSLTGYEVNDDFQRSDNKRIYEAAMSIAAYAHAKDPNIVVSIGHPWRLQLRKAFEGAAAGPDMIKNGLYDRMNLPFNVQTLISGGQIVSMTAKANLYRNDRGYENRYFNEWNFDDVAAYAKLAGIDAPYGTIPVTLTNGVDIPFGRPLIYVTDKKGYSYIHAQAICEDKWVATRYDSYPNDDSRYEQMNIIPSITRYLGTKDGVVLEVPNASPPSRLKQDKHMHLDELASKYADVVIDTDGLGTSGATFAQYGHRLIAQNSQTISAGSRMKFGQVATTTSIVEITNADLALESKVHKTLIHKFKNPSAKTKTDLVWNEKDTGQEWDSPNNPDRWKEELIRNTALWKFDYMRKAGSIRRANALSGGQDSGFNCATEYVMVCLGINQLGVEGFCDALNVPYKDEVMSVYKNAGEKAAIKAFMNQYLITYYMPTNNSSDDTLNAARALIEGGVDENGNAYQGIGGRFVVRNVQDLVTMCVLVFGVENTTQMSDERKQNLMLELSSFVHASPHEYTSEEMNEWAQRLQSEYSELKDLTSAALPGQGVAYENFQARIRTVLIWAAANVNKAMSEANPNLDESYGAYATGAGDLHGGGINSNAGIHKEDEQSLLRYLEEKGLHGALAPIKSLHLINNNEPSAELQPKKDGEVAQFDKDALQGTFAQKAVLSRLRHHTKLKTENGERWMNAGEIYQHARVHDAFHMLDDNRLFNAIVYFYNAWEGPAQHKIHFSPIAPTHGENVDKQTSLRTPNLSGRSKDEIVQLGIDLLFKWAKQDGLNWKQKDYELLSARAWQDKKFVTDFYTQIKNHDKSLLNMNYNLRGLYTKLKDQGWDQAFGKLPENHPINVVHSLRLEP